MPESLILGVEQKKAELARLPSQTPLSDLGHAHDIELISTPRDRPCEA
jgi:hypothetical protein